MSLKALQPWQQDTLQHIEEEARKTKPAHYSLLNAVGLLITERFERGILTLDDALLLFEYALLKYKVPR